MDLFAVDRERRQGEVQLARGGEGQEVVGHVLVKAQLQLLAPASQLPHDGGQQIGGDRRNRRDAETASPEIPIMGQGSLGVIDFEKNRLRTLEQKASGIGKDRPTDQSLEQGLPQAPFELLDLLAQGRLGHMAAFRGAGEVARFRDRDEVSKLRNIHRCCLSYP